MAVYTKLSEKELKEFFTKYDLGNLLNYKEYQALLLSAISEHQISILNKKFIFFYLYFYIYIIYITST